MTAFVLDASFTLKWCFKDEATEQSRQILARLLRGSADVPAAWPFKIANAVVKGIRRRRIHEADGLAFLRDLDEMRIRVHSFEADPLALYAAGVRHDLAAYDATYVDLALELDLPLATDDQAMRRAAERAGVVLL